MWNYRRLFFKKIKSNNVKLIKNFPKIDVVILAGGKGSRIKKYLKNSSKPMLIFKGRSLIDYIIKKFQHIQLIIFTLWQDTKEKIFKKFNKKNKILFLFHVMLKKKLLELVVVSKL